MTVANLTDTRTLRSRRGTVTPAPVCRSRPGCAAAGHSMPVHAIDVELFANQVVGVADNDAICCWVEVDDVTRPDRSAGSPLRWPRYVVDLDPATNRVIVGDADDLVCEEFDIDRVNWHPGATGGTTRSRHALTERSKRR